MRFAERDTQAIKVLHRRTINGKRLEGSVAYDSVGVWIPAVIKPVQSRLAVELYGERIQRMKLLQTHYRLVEGDRVEIYLTTYKVVAGVEYSQHKEYTIEEVEV